MRIHTPFTKIYTAGGCREDAWPRSLGPGPQHPLHKGLGVLVLLLSCTPFSNHHGIESSTPFSEGPNKEAKKIQSSPMFFERLERQDHKTPDPPIGGSLEA